MDGSIHRNGIARISGGAMYGALLNLTLTSGGSASVGREFFMPALRPDCSVAQAAVSPSLAR